MADHILIVDDDVDSLKLIGLMLQRHGYEVTTMNKGSQALAYIESNTPDLIILDVMMPDMNGLDISRHLRSHTRTQDIPIIMFTAKTMIDDKVKGFEAGADDYLTKPTHPTELASRVRAMLESRQPRAAEPEAIDAGVVYGVLGVKGGVGTSTVALNLAAAMLKAGDNPILSDFRLGYGTIGLSLGLKTQGMTNAIRRELRSANDLEQQFVTHQSGLRGLLSTAHPQESYINIAPNQAVAIVQGLQQRSSHTVLDLGHGLSNLNEALLRQVDRLLLTIEATPVALQMANILLKQLEQFIDRKFISVVVVQRTLSTLQTPWPEIENRLQCEVLAMIAASPDLVVRAMQQKTAMVLLDPSARVSGQFTKLAEDLKQRIHTIA